ncbi:MAG: sucC [Chlamydiia bacterium]|nr:sucC [Chlamydiia bacterium]
MELHEYQAKELLQELGVKVGPFFVASSIQEVERILQEQQLQEAVVKVQVHAGGRGKAGGVIVARSPQEILTASKKLLGMKIINGQTGPDGLIAHTILLTPIAKIKKEYYVGITIDRKTASTSLIISSEGGMDIETVATETPEKLLVEKIFKKELLEECQLERIATFLGWQGVVKKEGQVLIQAMRKAFFLYDAYLLEINPLVETMDGHLLALDAKLSIDDNSLFRQARIAAMYDPSQETYQEAEAKKVGLAYIGLTGTIGCMVNGAGLAMATMDLIHSKGGNPANFLDVGGGASEAKVIQSFEILLSDPHIKAILVNIFGGIMNCETIARALKVAVENNTVRIPIVLRMEGTNVASAKKIIEDSQLGIMTADTFNDAAEMVVAWQS